MSLGSLWARTRPIRAGIFFLGGIVYSELRLTRIDRRLDNGILFFYLVALGGLLVADRRIAHGRWRAAWAVRRREWFDDGCQFLFGSLYSAYVVYYFKAAGMARSAVFLVLLTAILVINEFYRHYLRLERLRLALFYLTAFSLLLFFIPVITGYGGPHVFGFAGGAAALLSAAVTTGIYAGRVAPEDPALPSEAPRGGQVSLGRALGSNAAVWAALLGLLWTLDQVGAIPPVPLALIRLGIYNDVRRTPEGYTLRYQVQSWPWETDDRVYQLTAGDVAYCFSAVFAPTDMSLTLYHIWERWDPQTDTWDEADRIPFPMIGGRDGGYRGFTHKRHLSTGEWRVTIETGEGRTLGRTSFEVVEAPGGRIPATKMLTY